LMILNLVVKYSSNCRRFIKAPEFMISLILFLSVLQQLIKQSIKKTKIIIILFASARFNNFFRYWRWRDVLLFLPQFYFTIAWLKISNLKPGSN
jgi:hypothetical protein